jgi:hypothetical protein
LKFKYYDANLKAEVSEADMVARSQTELGKEKLKVLAGNDDYRKGE